MNRTEMNEIKNSTISQIFNLLHTKPERVETVLDLNSLSYSGVIEGREIERNGFHIAILIILIVIICILLANQFYQRKLYQVCRKKNCDRLNEKFNKKYKKELSPKDNAELEELSPKDNAKLEDLTLNNNAVIPELEVVKGMSNKILNELTELKQKCSELNNNNSVAALLKKLKKHVQKRNILSSKVNHTINAISTTFQDINKDIQWVPITFVSHGNIVLNVNENQNVVNIKQQLCKKMNLDEDAYKQMKMKNEKNEDVDDNEYLLKNLNPKNSIIQCYFNKKIPINDIFVLNLKKGKMQLPDILQINKNQTFQEVRKIIKKITNSKNLAIFKEQKDNEGLLEIKDQGTFEDGDCLTVVERKTGEAIIKCILDENLYLVSYTNTNKISSLMTMNNDFILLFNNMILNQNKFIFEYEIDDGSILDCYILLSFTNLSIEENKDQKPIETNKIFQLYSTINKAGDKILYKKYSIKSYLKDEWKNKIYILNELKAFRITRLHKRFVQLLGTFLSENDFYVSIEFMSHGTLNLYLKLNKNLSINLFKWSVQILEGLKFLHDQKFVYRDLNPSNILVHENLDLKLSSSNYSQCDYNDSQISLWGKQTGQMKGKYIAPEVFNNEFYGMECDIWSFGAVLIRIVTGEKLYPKMNAENAHKQIKKFGKIEYNSACIISRWLEFIPIIDSCVQYDRNQRKTTENLLQRFNV